MNEKLTIQERLKDLRVNDRRLTLGQLAEATGLARSTLGSYESNDYKDISPFNVAILARFYGVSTDYLLGLAEQKNHPDAEVLDLHLSDEMLDILRSGEINNRLLCEIVTHKEFRRLLADIERGRKFCQNKIQEIRIYTCAHWRRLTSRRTSILPTLSMTIWMLSLQTFGRPISRM